MYSRCVRLYVHCVLRALHVQSNPLSGVAVQSHYTPAPPAASAVSIHPVNQAQAFYAAASHMMLGNMMDQLSNKRRKKRSDSPKRRNRSRSESPQRNKRSKNRHRNTKTKSSPAYPKRNYSNRGARANSQPKREEVKSNEKKTEEKAKDEQESENIYQPPTPEQNVVAPEDAVEEGNKTPDYQMLEGNKTPEYDAVTGSALTPPSSENQVTSSQSHVTSAADTTTNKMISLKPIEASPKMISLKKIRDTDELSSPAPNVGVKSLAEILREQALQSMKRKPTPERESESVRKSQETPPDRDSYRTRVESPTLDRSTTETSKLVRPFDDIDRNVFQPEDGSDSEDDFYSDDEFDPAKYHNSEDELLASPNNKLSGITMNFTVTPKMSKEEKKKAKQEKKRLKEAKKKKKEEKRLRKLAKKQAASVSLDMAVDYSDKAAAPSWQRKMIGSHLSGDNTPQTNSPNSSPSSTPEHDDAEFLKTPERCDDILFEAEPDPVEEPKPKKKSKRKVVVLNKDSKTPSPQPDTPEETTTTTKPNNNPFISSKPPAAVFSATIRSLVPNREQSSTISTTNVTSRTPPAAAAAITNRSAKGFNPFLQSAQAKPLNTLKPSPIRAPETKTLKRELPTRKPDVDASKPAAKRIGGVKTIKIRKAVTATPAAAAVSTAPFVPPVAQAVKPIVKAAAKAASISLDDDLDDLLIDKELDLLNAALDDAPSSTNFKPTSKVQDPIDNDDSFFADIDEILNEERRNLELK